MKKNTNLVSNIVNGVTQFATDTLQNKYYPSVYDLINTVVGIPITGYSSFTYISEIIRNRLLSFNANDYNERFASLIESLENSGQNVTRIQTVDGETNYLQGQNIQWNEHNSSEIGQDDNFDHPDSILTKTKILFNNNKIDSIISRFHTYGNIDKQDRGNSGLISGNASTKRYGMSHGRNLLTREAENGSNPFTDGYENPYCRVWTHFHQYDTIDKLIRPFTDKDGTPTSLGNLQKDWYFIRGRKGAERLNNGSVLNKNGFVNIAPSYDSNKDLKIHTKKCMFSIENLAWKGFSKYDFEKTLSWEQRGPMGGRIMWFPPYDIKFSESTSVNWNSDSFMGRGEKVYTYIDTERSGTLSFKLVVDHPAIINYFEGHNTNGTVPKLEKLSSNDVKTTLQDTLNAGFNKIVNEEKITKGKQEPKDTDYLRFFAGCDTLEGKPKNLTDEYTKEVKTIVNPSAPIEVKSSEPVFVETEPAVQGEFSFYVYYPNNYSGVNDKPGNVVEAMAYLLNGVVCQKEKDGKTDGFLQFSDMNNRLVEGGFGTGYEMSKEYGVSHLYQTNGKYGSINGKYMSWKYRIDREYIDQKLAYKSNEIDQDTSVSHSFNGLNIDATLGYPDSQFSFAEVAYALSGNNIIKSKAITVNGFDKRVDELRNIFKNYKILKVLSQGIANSHGNNLSEDINKQRNHALSLNRGLSVIEWLKTFNVFKQVKPESMQYDINVISSTSTRSVSDIDAKKKRAAKVTIYYEKSATKVLSDTQQNISEKDGNMSMNNFQENKIVKYGQSENGEIEYGSYTDEIKKDVFYFIRGKGKPWVPQDRINEPTTLGETIVISKTRENEFNNVRYDQEYKFFQVLKEKNPIIWEKFHDKIKHFNPAFHSMTPEGFNSRLTFLQQCCRQGNTVGASDANRSTASNMSFGRPPFCVLRIGDFYNTKIAITNVSFDFDPLQWDLNSEGIGVQPLIANVEISFNFIGGSDLSGPIARLQNAMTFNYLANTSVYDNRTDTVTYDENGDIVTYDGYVTDLSNDN